MMRSLDHGCSKPPHGRSNVQRSVTRLENGLIAALICLVLLFTMTNAAVMLPALSFISAK